MLITMKRTLFPYFLVTLILTVVNAVPSTTSFPLAQGGADVARRDAVRDAFLYNYRDYVKYAFGHDYLNAADKTGENSDEGGGFGGTIADALSTMVIMGLTDTPEYHQALAFVQNRSYTNTSGGVSSADKPGAVTVFDTTLVYIGGFLSAFQLNGEKPAERFLVQKARSMADALSGAWYKGARLPLSKWYINDQEPVALGENTNIAQAGSLTMEWGTLSQYTKNESYRALTEGSVDAIRGLQTYLPSLPFVDISPINLTTTSKYITIGGGFDSYLEYLVKYPVLRGDSNHRFLATYEEAISSIQQHLVLKSGINNFTFLADYDANVTSVVNIFSHLACFIGGNLAMSGRLMHRDDWTQLGLEFTESCYGTYYGTELHLGPYGFGYADRTGNFTGWKYISTIQRKFYNQHGFFVSVGFWFIAPEVLESLFYAYRITGMQLWRDLAWNIFQTIKQVADGGTGWLPVVNVNDESSFVNGEQPTFLYAETLNYLYLIFDDENHISLDDYVFTTQGHPFKRASSTGFGKVQGKFPYKPITTPITGVKDPNDRPTDVPSDLVKPTFIHQVAQNANKQQVAHALTSNTDMPHSAAMAMLCKYKSA